MNVILSARQARDARVAAQLSQGKVAVDLGINRTYLSQFESGKYLFDDSTLTRLRDYYAQRGYSVGGSVLSAPVREGAGREPDVDAGKIDTPRLKDGFLVPDAVGDEEADVLLTEYAENRGRLTALLGVDLTEGWYCSIFGVDQSKVQDRLKEALTLMARNFALVEQLRGHETVLPTARTREGSETRTIGDFLSAHFADVFGYGEEFSETGEK